MILKNQKMRKLDVCKFLFIQLIDIMINHVFFNCISISIITKNDIFTKNIETTDTYNVSIDELVSYVKEIVCKLFSFQGKERSQTML
jgi:hypothetical protein